LTILAGTTFHFWNWHASADVGWEGIFHSGGPLHSQSSENVVTGDNPFLMEPVEPAPTDNDLHPSVSRNGFLLNVALGRTWNIKHRFNLGAELGFSLAAGTFSNAPKLPLYKGPDRQEITSYIDPQLVAALIAHIPTTYVCHTIKVTGSGSIAGSAQHEATDIFPAGSAAFNGFNFMIAYQASLPWERFLAGASSTCGVK
jgi:hypothetical protein